MNLLRSSLFYLMVIFLFPLGATEQFFANQNNYFTFSQWNPLIVNSFDNLAVNCYQNPLTDYCMNMMFTSYYQNPLQFNLQNLEVKATDFLPPCVDCMSSIKEEVDNVAFNSSVSVPLDTSKIKIVDIEDKQQIKVSSVLVKGKYKFVPLDEFKNLKPLPLYPKPKTGMSRMCHNFIERSGKLGNYGKSIIKYIRQYDAFYNPRAKNITKVCKNWNKLTNKEKEIFWVWTFAAIAHTESSCNPKTLVSGMPGRKAAGLLQIEYSRRSRRAAARPRVCQKLTPAQTLGVKGNLSCSIAMMAGFINKPQWNFLFDKRTYWHRLRSGTNLVKKHLNKNPVCNN